MGPYGGGRRIIHVEVGTLRNWEQDRGDPTGPARALRHIVRKKLEKTLCFDSTIAPRLDGNLERRQGHAPP